MKKCKEIEDQLWGYLNGDLSEQDIIIVDQHLAECDRCQEALKLEQKFLDALEGVEDQMPSVDMKLKFDQMVDQEQQKIIDATMRQRSRITIGVLLQYAAAVLVIFCCGYFMGTNKDRSTNEMEWVYMQSELVEMKQQLTLATLQQPSSSERLKAVNLIGDQSFDDKKVVATLIKSLQSDASVNVRMAAANALLRFPNNPLVKDAFLDALKNQKDASMQITLINIIIQLKEARAKEILREIIEEKTTLPVVKELAREGVQYFVL